ncbi:MAG: hypothetical protein ABEJ04_01620 [Halobacteriaceae archaeon]
MVRVRGRRRAQVVLLAAAVVALALLPVVTAYLQLGYHGDVAVEEGSPTVGDLRRALSRGVDRTARTVDPPSYNWTAREAAVTAFRSVLAPGLNRLRATDGAVVRVSYNRSAARRLARTGCPRGPDRQFGDCRSLSGVVVQNRAGRTHLVAVAFDVRVLGGRRRAGATVTLGPAARRRAASG